MAITKKQILEYVKNTPDNTNINVLAPMLDELGSGDSKEEINLTVTTNGTYTPEVGKTYKKVVVNVPSLLEVTIDEPGPEDDEYTIAKSVSNYSASDVLLNERNAIVISGYDTISDEYKSSVYLIVYPEDVQVEGDFDFGVFGLDLDCLVKIEQSETQGLYNWTFFTV